MEALGSEPDDDPFAVTRRSRVRVGADAVAVVVGKRSGAHDPPPPDLAAFAFDRDQQDVHAVVGAQAVGVQELLAAEEVDDRLVPGNRFSGYGRGDEHQIAHHDRGGMPPALEGQPPADVLLRRPVSGSPRFGLSRAPRAPPLGPLGLGVGGGRADQESDHAEDAGAGRRSRHSGAPDAPLVASRPSSEKA